MIIITDFLAYSTPRRDHLSNVSSPLDSEANINAHTYYSISRTTIKARKQRLELERKMSSTPTGTAGAGSSFPFNDENQTIQWPPLSIFGVVVTVLGFIVVTWFIFWISRREKSRRRRATAGMCPLGATNLCKPSRLEAENPDMFSDTRQQQPLPMFRRYC